jgi:hypothetical protein
MTPTRRISLLAGALYLLSAIAAGVPILYVPSHFIVDGNASATSANILGSGIIFRLCIVSELVGAILLGALVVVLYRLFSPVDKRQAGMMVILALLSVPITFVGVLTETAALAFFRGGGFLTAFDKPQLDALGMLCLDLHGDGVSLANIFWGLWLFPFGMLVLKSGVLPRILGAWLLVNCLALVIVSFTGFLAPAYLDRVTFYAVLPELGELWTMIWLLVKGARQAPA